MCSHGGQMMDDNEDEDNINVVFSCFEFQICLKLYILNIWKSSHENLQQIKEKNKE